MEKLKISIVGPEKEVQTKFGAKKKMGVQFEQHPNVWHDVWTTGLTVGQEITGTRESREWEGKTFWTFKLPKKGESEITSEDFLKLSKRVTGLEMSFERKFAELKSDLVLQQTGKFQTDKDYQEYSKPHPFQQDGADDFANVPEELDF